LGDLLCEVCGLNPAKADDILCKDCEHYYMQLLEMLGRDPESFDRLQKIYAWRMKKLETSPAMI
jgi:hypothetical protein